MGTGQPQAGNEPMAEQEPLRAPLAMVMSMSRKGTWPKDKPEAPVAVNKAVLSRYLETSVPVCGVVLEPLRAKAMDKPLAEQ